jgi:hypothetical protein
MGSWTKTDGVRVTTQGRTSQVGTMLGRRSSGGIMKRSGAALVVLTLVVATIAACTTAVIPGTTSPGGTTPPGGATGGSGSGSSSSGLATATGAYTLDGGTATQSDETYAATNTDESGVYVLNGGTLTLNNPTVITSGDTSSQDNSSFYGLNAGILAASGSRVDVNGGTITTTGSGANGAFATGSGTVVNLSDVAITASGDGGHGVMATQGGVMTLENVDMNTSGPHSAPIATDRGVGTITATGGTVVTRGQDSPCYYSTGTLNITGGTGRATGSEAAVIEGANSITLNDCTVESSVAAKWGVMIYQTMSGDAEGADGVFTMSGGLLNCTATDSPLFFVTNTTAHVNLTDVDLTAASGQLLLAEGTSRWGTSGSNGGTVLFIADGQALSGDMSADAISSIVLTLRNGSSLTGAMDSANTAKSVSVALDASSMWTLTADSYVTVLNDVAGISGTTIINIVGNGRTVHYDSSANPSLGGRTYSLSGGGTLTPGS